MSMSENDDLSVHVNLFVVVTTVLGPRLDV